MMAVVSPHYDRRYFEWYKVGGHFGARADIHKFRDFIERTDSVVDFGCGGGFTLAALACHRRLGIEINPVAQEHCRQLGLTVISDLAEVDDAWADVVISNHALEHTLNPYRELLEVYRILKSGGMAVFFVPCERHDTTFKKGDVNQHLYTWSPMNLGNLFTRAGFDVVECREFVHRWPPKWEMMVKVLGWNAFQYLCRFYGAIARRCSQVRIVARKL